MTVRVANTQSEGATVRVNEGSRVNMTCAVDANPPLEGVREWTRGQVAVYQVSAGFVACFGVLMLTAQSMSNCQWAVDRMSEIALCSCKTLLVGTYRCLCGRGRQEKLACGEGLDKFHFDLKMMRATLKAPDEVRSTRQRHQVLVGILARVALRLSRS